MRRKILVTALVALIVGVGVLLFFANANTTDGDGEMGVNVRIIAGASRLRNAAEIYHTVHQTYNPSGLYHWGDCPAPHSFFGGKENHGAQPIVTSIQATLRNIQRNSSEKERGVICAVSGDGEIWMFATPLIPALAEMPTIWFCIDSQGTAKKVVSPPPEGNFSCGDAEEYAEPNAFRKFLADFKRLLSSF